MLQFLKIRNLALMDAVELEFEGGFNVVTGETGAGKSVLLGALAILAGNRVAKTVIRKGADACEIEAVVALADPARADAVLDALALPRCEDGQLILRRAIHATKPGRVTINGALATLAQLSALGETWIDFHGPGEPQKLFHEHHQLEILDLFAGNGAALADFAARFREWKKALAEIEEIRSQEKMSPDEIAFAQSQRRSPTRRSSNRCSAASTRRSATTGSPPRSRRFCAFPERFPKSFPRRERSPSAPPRSRSRRRICARNTPRCSAKSTPIPRPQPKSPRA